MFSLQPAMNALPNDNNVIFHDSSDFVDMFKRGWTYPQRPLVINQYVPYKILNAECPSSFYLTIDDSISELIQESVISAQEKYKDNSELFEITSFPLELLLQNMPVVVLQQMNFTRAEVNTIDLDNKTVKVTLIDSGEVAWVEGQDVYPPSTDLLRYPKLAIRCALSQVIPVGTKWRGMDYVEILQGKSSSLVCPIVYSQEGILEVYLECDQKDVGILMTMTMGLADFVPLEHYFDTSHLHVGKYPKCNFDDWIGLAINIFGIKMINYREAILQLNPLKVNEMCAVMKMYIEGVPKVTESFPKEKGDPCIVKTESGELFRATIIGTLPLPLPGRFLVKLVDYWGFQVANDNQLFKIPNELVAVPEGATMCLLADTINNPEKKEIIEPLLPNILEYKNLFCRIRSVNSKVVETEPSRPMVELSQAKEDEEGTPLWKLFDLPKPPLRSSLVFNHQFLNSEVAAYIFSGTSDYLPDKMYHGVLSCAENEKSIWLQLTDDARKADILTQELTNFYGTWEECPKLTSEMVTVGSYVVAQQKGDVNWYRAKVIKVYPDRDLYQVVFLDYGNHDFVPLSSMKGMINYFGKFKCLGLQVALPIVLKPNIDLDTLSDYILNFCDTADKLSVWLQHQNGFYYAWILSNKISLAHALLNDNFASGLLFQPSENIFQ